MRTLQDSELSFVFGGLTTDPKKSFWDKMMDWINGLGSPPQSGGGGGGGTPISGGITGAELGQLQRDCLNAGKNFTITQTSDSASAALKVVQADGSTSYFNYSCSD